MCINVALYSPGKNLWTMTERTREHMSRDATSFTVGPSSLHWDEGTLTIDFDEISPPFPPRQFLPKRVAGKITLKTDAITDQVFDIDCDGKQKWWPIAPSGHIDLVFAKGGLPNWSGHGYMDCNWGSCALEETFQHWDWARGDLGDGQSVIVYDTQRRDGSEGMLALHFDAHGKVTHFDAPARQAMKSGAWGVKRNSHHEDGAAPRLAAIYEDGPFYLRSKIATRLLGRDVDLMHESFSGDRFAKGIVKAMLPFRMPRRGGMGYAYFAAFSLAPALFSLWALSRFL